MADVSADRIIGVIRCLSADQPSAANSGHPGAPMGMAPAAYALWSEVMNYNPADANWPNRDRFVLSNGHASALLYSMLHLTGYAVTLDDLKNFRQIGSITPGHPENHDTEGVEVTTGPLGNGFGNAVGLAIAQSHLAAVFNKPDFDLLDNYTYVFMGDGCNQEGVASEAASLAGHLKLGRLIVIYDDNDITIDGETDLSFTEDVGARYEAYGWHVTLVEDGDSDVGAIVAAIEECKAVTDKPSLIRLRTTIGFGSAKEGTESVHGSPLSSEDLSAVKAKFGLDPEATFQVPDDVKDAIAAAVAQRSAKHGEWTALFERYTAAFPDEAAEFTRRFAGELPADWRAALPSYTPDDKATATRSLSGAVLNALAPIMPEIVGGSADLTPSTKTELKCSHDYQADTPDGRYLRYGVREHAMAALMNGLAAYGAIIPFGATFLNFIGYAWGGVRLSAISHRRAIYIMTHDSIGLGEDGPTHQPIESLASVRATPNMLCIRPADGNETVGAYIAAIEATETPSVLSLSRQNLPHLAGSSAEGVLKGAYTVLPATADTTSLILVASGSEVSLCVDVAAAFDGAVAVVSMPCWELFDAQDQEYQLSVFPAGVPVLSVEAGAVTGWERYAHCSHGMRTFGASGSGDAVMAHFGFSVESITEKAQTVIDHYSNVEAEALVLRPFF